MNRTVVLVAAALSLSPYGDVVSQQAHPPPPMPRRLEGYCEGESCGFNYQAVVCSRLTLRSGDRAGAAVTGGLAPGDTVLVTTGNLSVRAPGIVALRRDAVLATDDGAPRSDTLYLGRGDTVYVLEYHELGLWTLWYRGRITEGNEFWNGPGQNYFGQGRDSLAGFASVAPTTESWLRLRGPRSIEGWWRREEGVLARPEWGETCP